MRHFDTQTCISRSAIPLFTAGLFALSSTAFADMYIGAEVGFVEQESFDIQAADNDVPTRCDQLLNSLTTNNAGFVALNEASLGGDCRRGQDTWETSGDVDTGVFAGFQLGYRFAGNLRAELEYIFNSHSGGDVEAVSDLSGGKDAELQLDEQGMEGMSSHSFLANIFYDFEKVNDKFTPYLGLGIGFSEVDLEYVATFARNLDPTALGSTPHAAAGTTTYSYDTLSDTVFVWQFMGGVDYEINDQWSLGLKARYMVFEDVEDGDRWDRLRSHDSAITTAGHAASLEIDPTVEYDLSVEDITAWALGANLKYHF